MAAGSRTLVVVNDRVDVALAARAHGVHLRSDSMATAEVRRMAPSAFLIGRSVHGLDEARQHAGGTDYLIAGAVWATASKPAGHPLLGVEGLAQVVRAVGVPVLAIGGVTLDRTHEVAAAGAAGLAAIGLFIRRPDSSDTRDECRACPLRDLAQRARAGYEGAGPSVP